MKRGDLLVIKSIDHNTTSRRKIGDEQLDVLQKM